MIVRFNVPSTPLRDEFYVFGGVNDSSCTNTLRVFSTSMRVALKLWDIDAKCTYSCATKQIQHVHVL